MNPASSTPLIELRDVSFSHGDRLIFDALSLSVYPGELLGIMGPSGTGKTTLLSLMTGQLQPDAGDVFYRGLNLRKISRRRLFALRREMGYLFQSSALLNDLTVFDNVALPLKEHLKLTDKSLRYLVLAKLDAVGLRGVADLMPHQLSGGMSRRVALARAMAMDPDVLFYDEPFVGQDPIMMGVLLRLIQRLNQLLDMTSIVVTHDVHEMLQIATRVCFLSQGKIVASGVTKDILTSKDPAVLQFINGEADGLVPFHQQAKDYRLDLHCIRGNH